METDRIKLKDFILSHVEWLKDYLREISVIIIGLCITYYGDSLMDSYTERQEDKEAIKMVQEELASNISELNDMQEYYKTDIRLSESFKTDIAIGLNNVKEDSIKQFKNQHRLYHYWTLKDHAFKMVRESATMQRIDKTLLTKLFECYEYLEVVEKMGESYREKRFNELLQFYNQFPADEQSNETTLKQWRQISANEQFRNYIIVVLPMFSKSSLSVCNFAVGKVKDIQAAIKEAYPNIYEDTETP